MKHRPLGLALIIIGTIAAVKDVFIKPENPWWVGMFIGVILIFGCSLLLKEDNKNG